MQVFQINAQQVSCSTKSRVVFSFLTELLPGSVLPWTVPVDQLVFTVIKVSLYMTTAHKSAISCWSSVCQWTSIMVFTGVKIRCALLYEFKLGNKGGEAARNIRNVFREDSLSDRKASFGFPSSWTKWNVGRRTQFRNTRRPRETPCRKKDTWQTYCTWMGGIAPSTLFTRLSRTDYHLSRSLNNHMRNKKFQNRHAVETTLTSFFCRTKAGVLQERYKQLCGSLAEGCRLWWRLFRGIKAVPGQDKRYLITL